MKKSEEKKELKQGQCLGSIRFVDLGDRFCIHLKKQAKVIPPPQILMQHIYTEEKRFFTMISQGEDDLSFELSKEKISNEMFEGNFGEWRVVFYQEGKEFSMLQQNSKDVLSLKIDENKQLLVESDKDGIVYFKICGVGAYLKKLDIQKQRLKIQVSAEMKGEQFQIVLLQRESATIKKANKMILQTREIVTDHGVYYQGTLDFSSDGKILRRFYGEGNFFLVCHQEGEEKYYPIRILDKTMLFPEYTKYRQSVLSFKRNDLNELMLQVTYRPGGIAELPLRITRRILYPLMQKLLPINDKKIVYESYWGKQISCNPLAIYEYVERHYPEYKNIWVVQDMDLSVSGSAVHIKRNSFRYFYHFATAKYFVNNVNFPDFYEKRKSAVELQTMHGTPLKTLGLDAPGEVEEGKMKEEFLRRCARWDMLTVPSDYVGEIAKRAYAYQNKLLKIGYPRNDSLFEKNNVKDIEKIKESLNLPKDKKIILYAPTWRVKGAIYTPLQLKKLQESLGEEYILLVRFHYFSNADIEIEKYPNFAYDMSKYDDIRNLYVISDILMTDYSSVMFDYAVLKRPMLFFTYDYENYKNELRGMYFDFEKEAPSKLLRTTEEIIVEIKDIEHYFDKYQEKYSAFTKKYNQYDKGNASEQAVKNLLEQ